MDVCPIVIPHAQTAKLIEPGKRPLPRPTATGQFPFRARCDAWRATARYVSSAVRAESPSRRSRDPRAHSPAAAAVAPFAVQQGNRIDQRQGFLRGRSGSRRSGEPRAARPARRKSDGACSRAWPDRWDSDRSGPRRTPRAWNNLSTTARDQSIWSERASQSRSTKWIRSHTPACCQSRTRRQH